MRPKHIYPLIGGLLVCIVHMNNAVAQEHVYMTIRDAPQVKVKATNLIELVFADVRTFLSGYMVPQICPHQSFKQCSGRILNIELLPNGNLSVPGKMTSEDNQFTIKIRRQFQKPIWRRLVIAHEIAHFLILTNKLPPKPIGMNEEHYADQLAGELLASSAIAITKNLKKEATSFFRQICPTGYCGKTHGATNNRIEAFENGVDAVIAVLDDAKQGAIYTSKRKIKVSDPNLQKAIPILISYFNGNLATTTTTTGNYSEIDIKTKITQYTQSVLTVRLPKSNKVSTGIHVSLHYERRFILKGKWHKFNQPNIQLAAQKKAKTIKKAIAKSLQPKTKKKSL